MAETAADLRAWAQSLRDGPRLGAAVTALADWASSDPWSCASENARGALRNAITNLLAVTAGAAAMPEQQAFLDAWDPEPGAAVVIGTGRSVPVEAAAWINGVNAVFFERDEGNRYAKGHPAVQTAPAILAVAERLGISGEPLWNALYVGYELATRFGRATAFHPDVHTHGTFGVPGAAAGCALLLGGDRDAVARAIEAAVALPPATDWATVLDGSALRDQWVGAGLVAGLAAARYGIAGLPVGRDGGTIRFGGRLGEIAPAVLVDDLGGEGLVTRSYLKQYSSCAYTHSSADAAILLRAELAERGLGADDVLGIEAEVTGLAAALDDRTWDSRPAAYFSVPFAVASALLYGDVRIDRAAVPAEPALTALAQRVTVIAADGTIPSPIPNARPARLTLRLSDGSTLVTTVAHPKGDALDTPFSREHFETILAEALAPAGLGAVAAHHAVAGLERSEPGAAHVALLGLAAAGAGID
ncbi:MAG TPA: MmgE/PrpD family protein [Gryllotalpicola sp.]